MASFDLSQLPKEYLDANQGPKVNAITIFAFTLAVVGVLLRFLARVLTKASLWWDDWLVLAALVRCIFHFKRQLQPETDRKLIYLNYRSSQLALYL